MVRKKSRKVNFATRWITLLEPGERRQKFIDVKVRGLGLLVQPSGHKSFYWTRKVNSRNEFQTLGSFPDLTVEQARDAAESRNNKFAKWKEGRFEGESPFVRRDEVTLDQLVDLYIAKHLKQHAKRPEQAEADLRWMIGKYLAPWRGRKLAAIRQEDVAAFHTRAGSEHGPRTANYIIKRLRTLFNFAASEKVWKGDNPARGIRHGGIRFFPENKRTRFLQPGELPQLFAALRRAPNPDLRDYVALALWTGARKTDILSMRWQDVSLDDNRWAVPDPKGAPYVIALAPEAKAILQERRTDGATWVFPSVGKSGHLVDLKGAWKKLLADAGLAGADLRQHDLRRTLASYMAAGGTSLPIIGKTLGHKSLAATEIYARLNLDPVRAAMESAISTMRALERPRLLPAPPKRKVARRG